ncbi:MAG: metallophosphoesterase [Chloroflexi bacterium]|nr:metallophosphoesterase [Chloroflexota bacterium]
MKFILFSDLHLDRPFPGLPVTQAEHYRQILRDTLRNIVALSQAEEAQALLCAGDLFEHDYLMPDTAEFLRQTFQSAFLPVYLAPGNRDYFGPSSVYNRLAWSSNVHVFTSIQLQPVILDGGLTLWGAAHRHLQDTPGFFDDFHTDRPGLHLALFHGSERTASSRDDEPGSHASFHAAQIDRAGFYHAFAGHSHLPQMARTYTCPGSPVPLDFEDRAMHGAVILSIDRHGLLHREWRSVSSVNVYDLTLDISQCSDFHTIKEHLQERIAGLRGFARVTLHGRLLPGTWLRLEELETVNSSLDGFIVRCGAVVPPSEVQEPAGELTARARFIREVFTIPGLAEDERRRILFAGLSALEGQEIR